MAIGNFFKSLLPEKQRVNHSPVCRAHPPSKPTQKIYAIDDCNYVRTISLTRLHNGRCELLVFAGHANSHVNSPNSSININNIFSETFKMEGLTSQVGVTRVPKSFNNVFRMEADFETMLKKNVFEKLVKVVEQLEGKEALGEFKNEILHPKFMSDHGMTDLKR